MIKAGTRAECVEGEKQRNCYEKVNMYEDEHPHRKNVSANTIMLLKHPLFQAVSNTFISSVFGHSENAK